MTLDELKSLIDSGELHHATYRDIGTIWEGLWIYAKSNDRIGYIPVGSFPKDNHQAAYDLVKHTGVSTGAYGKG